MSLQGGPGLGVVHLGLGLGVVHLGGLGVAPRSNATCKIFQISMYLTWYRPLIALNTHAEYHQ